MTTVTTLDDLRICGRAWLTVPEAGALLGMGRARAYRLVREQRFPCPVEHWGSRAVVLVAELHTYLRLDDIGLGLRR